MPNSKNFYILLQLNIEEKVMATKFWDKLGICASGLCLIHCLATPVLLLLFPTFKLAFLEHHAIHEILAVLVVSSVLIAVYPQCRKHGHKDIIAYALIGVFLILGAVFLGHDIGEEAEHIMTIFGSLFLLFAHYKNIRVRHGKCETTSCDSHTNKVITE